MNKQVIINSLIKLASPFGYPDLQPSNEPVNPDLKERLIDQKHEMEYMEKLLDGKVYKTDADNMCPTPLNCKAKNFLRSLCKQYRNNDIR